MKTVPLHGQKAAGRVALVNDEDYDLVMQYRWHVAEKPATPTRRQSGPYAVVTLWQSGRYRTLLMHELLTGWPQTDHADHDGLNNQRSNLRPATVTQNAGNQLPRLSTTSPYKGVSWHSRSRRWQAGVQAGGRRRYLGFFLSELEAAYAYDAAAREMFGEFACTNFPDAPGGAARRQWQAAKDAALADCSRTRSAAASARWTQRTSETRVCTICGSGYQTRAIRPTFYCGEKCRGKSKRLRKKERELEGRLF